MSQSVLTNDQQKAFDALLGFLCDPNETFFVLEGFAGTGKTFLMKEVINEWERIQDTVTLMCPAHNILDVVFTATTNKAAEELQRATGHQTRTIFSALGLKLENRGNRAFIAYSQYHDPIRDSVIIIDEASYLDNEIINRLQLRTKNCKFIFLGDPAQLIPVGMTYSPIFSLGFNTVRMEEVRRNQGNILDLSTKFRESVFSGEFPQFTPDGKDVLWLPGDEFQKAIDTEFSRTNWKYSDSKILTWQNSTAIEYGKYVKDLRSGTSSMMVGDYMSNNSYVRHPLRNIVIKTDEMVLIDSIHTETVIHGVLGRNVIIKGCLWFCPNNPKDIKTVLLKASSLMSRDYSAGKALYTEAESWLDLRELASQTVNKSQGSTYKKVFIDLNDLAECSSSNQLARMLYVATSRATEQVIFTGDIV